MKKREILGPPPFGAPPFGAPKGVCSSMFFHLLVLFFEEEGQKKVGLAQICQTKIGHSRFGQSRYQPNRSGSCLTFPTFLAIDFLAFGSSRHHDQGIHHCSLKRQYQFHKQLGQGPLSQKQQQISELQFDKFPVPQSFLCWKLKFKSEVTTFSIGGPVVESGDGRLIGGIEILAINCWTELSKMRCSVQEMLLL